jgi:rhodanese-related sulfurtransferase
MYHLIRVLISAVLIAVVASCGLQSTTDIPINNVDVNTTRDLVTQDETVIVLDVRTPEEYAIGHIVGALNINIAEADFSKRISKLDRDKTYIIHCSANVKNGRSAKSLEIMSSFGFDKLLNMEGGIIAWEQSGYPLVRSGFQ